VFRLTWTIVSSGFTNTITRHPQFDCLVEPATAAGG
jgi:hypothetical protein